jgi:hypothetical protein
MIMRTLSPQLIEIAANIKKKRYLLLRLNKTPNGEI